MIDVIAPMLFTLAVAAPLAPGCPAVARVSTVAPPTASAAPATAPPSPDAAATTVPAAAPSALSTLAPSAVPTLAPSALPAPVVTPSPTSAPYSYRFVPRQPEHVAPGQPQIFAVYLNEKKLRSHGAIRIRVETSQDVVKVVSRSNGREGLVPLVTAGDFEASGLLPKIPFIAAGMTVDLEFIATGPDGRKTSVRVPVQLAS
ncbi:MAG: hypothetical protein NVS3B10_12110 [Polyangiales bacterium]